MAIVAILLAAGYATRLYPLTKDRPKALLPLGRRTILDEVLSSLQSVQGVRKRLLVTNHRFAQQFHNWQRTAEVEVDIFDDQTDSPDTRLGAIRDVELARQRAGPNDDLLVIGTDNLFHWPLDAFVSCAARYHPHPAIALTQLPAAADATQFGVAVRDRASRITGFVEKSPQPPSRDVALCVYYFPAPMCHLIRRFLDEGGNADAPGYFIEWLVRHEEVYGVLMPGAWYDIGTLEAYEAAGQEWAQRRRGER